MNTEVDTIGDVLRSKNLLALLVDDSPNALSQRAQLLEQAGFRVIRASDELVAQREFAASPSICFAMVDINLHAERHEDKSGVGVARRLREAIPDLPIIGYSGAFAEDQLSEEDYAPFSEALPRGRFNADEILANIAKWMEQANRFWEMRKRIAEEKLADLRVQYKKGSVDFELVRLLVPASSSNSSAEGANVEETLREAGYSLRVVDSGQSRPTVSGESVLVSRPVWVWTKDCQDHFAAEIYGFPELYAVSESETEAIENLLMLMDGLLADLSSAPELNSARLNEVAGFLRQALN